jgi:threonine synthase
MGVQPTDNNMQYYSLNKIAPNVNFKDATINGQAPDKGLYFPTSIPKFENDFIQNIEKTSNADIAFKVIKPFIGNEINDEDLFRIASETIDFEIPLVPVTDNIFSLELYHGPTLAFKDIGARFMSRCLGHFVKDANKEITVLVATSGDTGGAVANGFYNVPGVNVVILYPSGKVSSVQEKQLTTLGKNITALEIAGNFDDCQAMVKAAFLDAELQAKLKLTSANSINVARWLPQQFYYYFAYKQWKNKNNPPVISVPSGNFGNICAGLIAYASGLPVTHFIAACNANNVVPNFFDTEVYTPTKAQATISNAMDVGDPSNFIRILQLFNNNIAQLKNKVSSVSISDADTAATLLQVYNQHNYLLDTHGAVAYHALENYLKANPQQQGMFLETAHPIKFYDVVEPIIKTTILIPDAIKAQLNAKKTSIELPPTIEALKEFLMG